MHAIAYNTCVADKVHQKPSFSKTERMILYSRASPDVSKDDNGYRLRSNDRSRGVETFDDDQRDHAENDQSTDNV